MWSFSDIYIEQGIVLGKEQGIVLGKEQGIVLGKEQGEKESILKYIKNKMRKNIPALEIKEDIMDSFELSSTKADEYFTLWEENKSDTDNKS